MKFDKIDAVVKITERCNINCTYCYMYNKGSELSFSKPKQLSIETAKEVAIFLKQSALEVGAKVVRLVIHGGEPLMMKPEKFSQICDVFIDNMKDSVEVQFTIQTNAMLVNEAWIAVFEKYRFGVGVSLDGNKKANDKFRIDHKGRGTYDKVMLGVDVLFKAAKEGRIHKPALLIVVDPNHDGREIFDHFVDKIGFEWMDFLLPIDTHESYIDGNAEKVGHYLADVFHAWQEKNDPKINIRLFDQFFTFATGYDRESMTPVESSNGTLVLTMSSDGTYGPDDTLRIVDESYFDHHVSTTSITQFLSDKKLNPIFTASLAAPEVCSGCEWKSVCVGGSNNGRVVNRYSKENDYQNKSVLCEGLYDIYNIMSNKMIENGYPEKELYRRMG